MTIETEGESVYYVPEHCHPCPSLYTNSPYDWTSRYPIPPSKEIKNKYDVFLDQTIFLPPEHKKLRGREFNPDLILNLENYLKIWKITDRHYTETLTRKVLLS
jgi:hypothetical protein